MLKCLRNNAMLIIATFVCFMFASILFAQDSVITETLTANMPAALITISGFICPVLIKFINEKVKNTKVRWWIATLFSGLWGVIGCLLAGYFTKAKVDYTQIVPLVILMSKLAYHNWFHDVIKATDETKNDVAKPVV